MSESISSNLLRRLRAGEDVPLSQLAALAENSPGEFFRDIVEPLCDCFDPRDARIYTELMGQLIGPDAWQPAPQAPQRVYVLSRVTLGADIKITSIILNAFRDQAPVFVGSRKSAELFQGVAHLEASYPRQGPLSTRVQFAKDLRQQLADGIVIDPDSRITQLGILPMGARYYHFNSRTAGANTDDNLSTLTNAWLRQTFGKQGQAFIDPVHVPLDTPRPIAAMSLGVGENESKRLVGEFESDLIRELAGEYQSVWIDRGAGGEEARRVTAAAEASGAMSRIHFWEGSFAGFTSIVQQSDFYAGYDSAGQHAAAAAGVPLRSYFSGAPSRRFIARWAPFGAGRIELHAS